MNNQDSYLWVEKYKPTNISECILPERIKTTLTEFVESNEIKSYIAVGGPGCGKTSSAKALLNEMGVEYKFINASQKSGVDTIRDEVVKYASRKTITGDYKVIILDECDYLSANAQASLRGITEEFYDNCRFILTANYENKIIEALTSRCPVIDFNFAKDERNSMIKQFLPKVASILKENNIEYDKKELINFVAQRFPDIRKTLNLLQRNSSSGTLEIQHIGSSNDEKIVQLISHIKNTDFTAMRKWVAENLDNDGHLVRTALYKKMLPMLNEDSIPSLILILNDYDRFEVQVKDLEIHMTAMCLTIMQECNFKE